MPLDSMSLKRKFQKGQRVKIPGASSGAFDKTSANPFELHAIQIQSRSANQAGASSGVSDPQRMKPPKVLKYGRPIKVDGMAYAPISELGVVYLFGRLAPQLNFQVEYIHPHFPDCIAKYKGEPRRIEFELWASDFGTHGHDPNKADMVVCWEDDWEDRPKKFRHLDVLSLKPHVDALPRIHTVGCGESNYSELESRSIEWNVSAQTQIGDLILMYRSAPVSAICDAWEVTGPFNRYSKRDKEGRKAGLQAHMKRVAQFKRPLSFDILKRDPRTKKLAAVKRRFQGKMDLTLDWFPVYSVLVELNPRAKGALRPYVVE